MGIIGIDHFDLLASEPFAHDRPFPLLEGWFEYIVIIWINCTLYHVFPEPMGGSDKDRILKARFGVNGEYNAGSGHITPDHLLDGDRQVDIKLAKALVVPV